MVKVDRERRPLLATSCRGGSQMYSIQLFLSSALEFQMLVVVENTGNTMQAPTIQNSSLLGMCIISLGVILTP